MEPGMKRWRVAIARDTAVPMLGLHGLYVACNGLPGVEVVGLFDSKADDLADVMAVTGAKQHYREYTQMLDTTCPDLVVCCSRHPHDHFQQIAAAAERGIHLYCEKPVTVSLQEADELVALIERNNIKFCAAHPSRYDAGFLQMKQMIADGAIGRPLTVIGRGKCDHRGGGEDMMVLGTHILDLQTFFFGAPQAVWAEVLRGGQPVRADERTATVEPVGPTAGDEIFAVFRLPDGVRAVFESRRGLIDRSRQRTHMGIAVVGSEGTLSHRFDDSGEATLQLSRGTTPPDIDAHFEEVPVKDSRTIPGAAPLEDSLRGVHAPQASMFLKSNRHAVWDLIQSIQENRQPISNLYNARLTLEMIYGVYASHLTGRVVGFPLTDRTHPLERR